MTSYFEIGGLIIESDSPSNPSFQSTVSVIERPERGRNSIRSQDASPQMSSDDYGIMPYRPFGSNPLGWAVSQVLLKGAEALVGLQEPEITAY
jgi:hypothetical protein